MTKAEWLAIAFAMAIFLIIAYRVGVRSGWREAKREATGMRLMDREWATKPCEILVPSSDLQSMWNADYQSQFRISLRRADRVTVEFKDCEHKTAVLAEALNVPANT